MLPREQHLVRCQHVSLFLDTQLVNAHTTALDVVWSGLPLVTTPHVRFASRVATSILITTKCLTTIGRNHDDYVDISVKLSSSQQKMNEIRRCYNLCRDMNSSSTSTAASTASPSSYRPCVLFDTRRWVEDFERLLLLSWETRSAERGRDRCSHLMVS
mmetsp:Transcript_35636/g.80406  ORF Transcript_35636/g.80406 Transcript_35636/m.80406 type:complete len:158 (-) Transcript_35636:101-574(-)